MLGPSIHLAPFLQGVLAHSSMSNWHWLPENPERETRRKRRAVNTKIPLVCINFIPPHSSIQHGQRSLIPGCKLSPYLSGFQVAFQPTIAVTGGEGCKMAVKTFQGLLAKGTRQRGTVYSVARQAMPLSRRSFQSQCAFSHPAFPPLSESVSPKEPPRNPWPHAIQQPHRSGTPNICAFSLSYFNPSLKTSAVQIYSLNTLRATNPSVRRFMGHLS